MLLDIVHREIEGPELPPNVMSALQQAASDMVVAGVAVINLEGPGITTATITTDSRFDDKDGVIVQKFEAVVLFRDNDGVECETNVKFLLGIGGTVTTAPPPVPQREIVPTVRPEGYSDFKNWDPARKGDRAN